jgi:hypothetical protein
MRVLCPKGHFIASVKFVNVGAHIEGLGWIIIPQGAHGFEWDLDAQGERLTSLPPPQFWTSLIRTGTLCAPRRRACMCCIDLGRTLPMNLTADVARPTAPPRRRVFVSPGEQFVGVARLFAGRRYAATSWTVVTGSAWPV